MDKLVSCTHCQGVTEVAPKARSIFCPHFNKRLVLQDFCIKTYHAVRELATCGEVVVEKRGHVVATVRAASLTVRGRVTGAVTARERVVVIKTGAVHGDIRAPLLRVENGAAVNGFLHIGPGPDGVAQPLAGPSTAAKTPRKALKTSASRTTKPRTKRTAAKPRTRTSKDSKSG